MIRTGPRLHFRQFWLLGQKSNIVPFPAIGRFMLGNTTAIMVRLIFAHLAGEEGYFVISHTFRAPFQTPWVWLIHLSRDQ